MSNPFVAYRASVTGSKPFRWQPFHFSFTYNENVVSSRIEWWLSVFVVPILLYLVWVRYVRRCDAKVN
jgi:hypothetical protein